MYEYVSVHTNPDILQVLYLSRKIIVHYGMSYAELNKAAGGTVSPALLGQYGIKIIDENKVATPGEKPVMVMMQMQNKHQSDNMMRNYKSDKMLKKS